jgi:hypothetical protein
MTPHAPSPDLAALRRHWRHWTALVALHARRRRGARVVGPQHYQTLHQQLLAACAAASEAAPQNERALYQRLEDLARPWLSARALEQTDREILLDLLARCRQADEELRPRSPLPGLRWLVAGVALLGTTTAVIRLGPSVEWSGLPGRDWVLGHLHAIALMAAGGGWWFLAAATAIGLAIIVVWRSGRNVAEE